MPLTGRVLAVVPVARLVAHNTGRVLSADRGGTGLNIVLLPLTGRGLAVVPVTGLVAHNTGRVLSADRGGTGLNIVLLPLTGRGLVSGADMEIISIYYMRLAERGWHFWQPLSLN